MWCDKTGLSDLYDQYKQLCDMLQCNPSLGISAAALMELYKAEFADEVGSLVPSVLVSSIFFCLLFSLTRSQPGTRTLITDLVLGFA